MTATVLSVLFTGEALDGNVASVQLAGMPPDADEKVTWPDAVAEWPALSLAVTLTGYCAATVLVTRHDGAVVVLSQPVHK